MDKWIAVLALAAPVVQALLMGVIGYPLARRRTGGMDAFHRSGFIWWLVTLAAIVVVGVVFTDDLLAPQVPSAHETISVTRIGITLAAAVAALIAVEALGSVVTRGGGARGQKERDRYESALPRWASGAPTESGLLTVTAVLEEAIYRGLALGGLFLAFDLDKPVAAGIVALAFGLAHWYYGPRQVFLKILVGSVLCAAAFSAGWLVAAIAHTLLNLILVAWSRRPRS